MNNIGKCIESKITNYCLPNVQQILTSYEETSRKRTLKYVICKCYNKLQSFQPIICSYSDSIELFHDKNSNIHKIFVNLKSLKFQYQTHLTLHIELNYLTHTA